MAPQLCNALITAHIEHARCAEALEFYDELEVTKRSDVSHVLALKACRGVGTQSAMKRGHRIATECGDGIDEGTELELINAHIAFCGYVPSVLRRAEAAGAWGTI